MLAKAAMFTDLVGIPTFTYQAGYTKGYSNGFKVLPSPLLWL